ncbi:hypothetical protein D3C80_1478580 [compost metagenome]
MAGRWQVAGVGWLALAPFLLNVAEHVLIGFVGCEAKFEAEFAVAVFTVLAAPRALLAIGRFEVIGQQGVVVIDIRHPTLNPP